MHTSYSIIIYNEDLNAKEKYLRCELQKGIKIIWFGKGEDKEYFKNDDFFNKFLQANLLQIHIIEDKNYFDKFDLIDGYISTTRNMSMEKLKEISLPKSFNVEQYLIEHESPKSNIVVKAGAGTGKTKVMIDRIMYLLHTEDIKIQEIAMITFTNEAAFSMKKKIKEEFIKRYRLTDENKYLNWLEDFNNMNIGTIHSFSKDLLEVFGNKIGYGENISIGNMKFEVNRIIDEECNYVKKLWEKNNRILTDNISNLIESRYFDMKNIIYKVWEEALKKNVSIEDLEAKDKNFTFIKEVLIRTEERFFRERISKNYVPLAMIIKDLNLCLDKNIETYSGSFKLKFIFVDEFQDSDNSQIDMLYKLKQITNCKIFAVGDVKQSIYRFRGATHTAFDNLDSKIKKIGESIVFIELIKNYRTKSELMKKMQEYFKTWSKEDYLSEFKDISCQIEGAGNIDIKEIEKKKEIEEALLDKIKELMDKNESIAVLTRRNNELEKIKKICRNHNIPCDIKGESNFYRSDAVMDFYWLINFILLGEDIGDHRHIYNFMTSPYIKNYRYDDLFLNKLIYLRKNNFGEKEIREYLYSLIDKETISIIEKYKNDFRMLPTLSVIRNILLELNPLDNMSYYNEIELKQYEANLNKLLNIFSQNFGNRTVSLYNIHSYLKNNIYSEGSSEEEAEIENNIKCFHIKGLTVHSSKGLEFDHVIIPYTNNEFIYSKQNPKKQDIEIIIDNNRSMIGIKCKYPKRKYLYIGNYEELKKMEEEEVEKEETRLLYVAMTRSKKSLTIIKRKKNEGKNWGFLLGVDK